MRSFDLAGLTAARAQRPGRGWRPLEPGLGRGVRGLGLAVASLLALAGTVSGAAPAPSSEPPAVIDTRGAPALGPEGAPVTIVEFGDFQCPSCAQGAQGLRRLTRVYPDRVRWVFKHYPLRTLHPDAALAHEAAIAAQEQGKFWEMHEVIFRNQTRVKFTDLVGYAAEIGLDVAPFKEALSARKYRPRVIRDMEQGRELRVFATPTYYVNGIRFMGARTASEFRSLVDQIAPRPIVAPPAAAVPSPEPAAGSAAR